MLVEDIRILWVSIPLGNPYESLYALVPRKYEFRR
jgi:hypothetical protein